MELTRRRALAFGAAAVGGVGAAHYATRPDAPMRLRFGDAVSEATRARCRRAARRTAAIVGREPDAPVRVVVATPDAADGPSDRMDRAVAAAKHVLNAERPDGVPAFSATYDRASRTVAVAAPDAVDRVAAAVAAADAPPAEDWFPPGPLLAHELTHAIQYDAVSSVAPADRTRDGRTARRAVVEGTAEYVAHRYRAACDDGEYDPCQRSPVRPARAATHGPSVVDRALPYANGLHYVRDVAARGGWDAVWERHRSPPATALSVTYPDVAADGWPGPVEVAPPPDTPSAWLEIGSDRLGVAALYVKLHALGVAETVAVAGDFRRDWAYRTPPLRRWRGGRFTAYGHVDDLDRLAYVWETAWESETAAAELAATVERGYRKRGEERTAGWVLDESFHTVHRDGVRVTLRMAPDRAAAATLFGDRGRVFEY